MITDIAIPAHAPLSSLLQSYPAIQAAALYGSVARGDSEPHSDTDLLIVCSDGHKRAVYQEVQAALTGRVERLSLSIYSARELQFLVNAHSLFLLHLQREAVVIYERSDVLSSILRSFEPKASYSTDYQNSLALLEPLIVRVSHVPNDLHRLAYVYTLFRVFGVYLLAERGIYEFSKSKMAACLSELERERVDDIALLGSLRVLNANFFSGGEPGQSDSQRTLPSLVDCMAALARFTCSPILDIQATFLNAVQPFMNAVAQRAHGRLDYRLRTWFLLLVYDGLNLFCKRKGIPELTSFDCLRLNDFLFPSFPRPVRCAAAVSVDYLHNYPLKYFLLEESKIPASRAGEILSDLVAEVSD